MPAPWRTHVIYSFDLIRDVPKGIFSDLELTYALQYSFPELL